MSGRHQKRNIKGRLHLSVNRKANRGENLTNWRKKQKELSLCYETVPTSSNTDCNDSEQCMALNPLCSVTPSSSLNDLQITGRRIVDIKYFLNELKLLNKHSPIGCSFSDMEVISEIRRGLISELKMKCRMCNFTKVISTENKKCNDMNCNAAAVAGIMKIGCGFSNMEEFLSTLNIPSMSTNTFIKEQNFISEAWETAATKEMEKAADNEKMMAIERGDVDAEGVPFITVIVDGTWAKRSYKTNFASLSGVAAIIGFHSKKVLFLGVRNKYCCICARAATKNTAAECHQCFKNWSGSSSGMEADILVDGFYNSIPMYGIKYTKFIGDGDSNVYKKILDSRPYTTTPVEKIECKNHLLRNACNKLKDLARCSKYGHVALRKIIASTILRVRTGVTMAIKFRKTESEMSMQQKITNLRNDILNLPCHIYGQHDKCAAYFCSGKCKGKNYVPLLNDSGLLCKIMDVIHKLADNAKSLICNVNSNSVEEFNNFIAKFVGGKRINYCLRRSYQTRCKAAVVAHNSKMPFYKLHKSLFQNSPGRYCTLSEKRKNDRRIKFANRRKNYKRKRLFHMNDSSYGIYAEKPDMDPDTYNLKKESFLLELKESSKIRLNIMQKTVLQNECPLWKEERRKRLTASNFGYVCKKLPYTKCDYLLKKILYSNFDNLALRYGREHEKDAIEQLSSLNISVKPCGLIIDEHLPFLAATPDGLIDDETILEIKCPAACAELTPEQAISARKNTIWLTNKKTKKFFVNKNHTYFYQVQGQLHIAQKKYCMFVLWTPLGIKIEKIEKDDSFWETNMRDKLINFYYDCLLPEILDPRIPRSLPIRNPICILNAIKMREQSTEISKIVI